MASEALSQLIAQMRTGGPDLDVPPAEARVAFDAMVAGMPAPPDSEFLADDLGGVPALRHGPADVARDTLLYLHGGGYVVGNAHGYRGLAAALGTAAGANAYTVDYRLAPEHPYPAAINDSVTAYRALLARGHDPRRIVIAGDSAGGGLTVAMLLRLRDTATPMPAAAFLVSPWADLGFTGASMIAKAAADPSLSEAGLRTMAGYYLNGADAADPLASPVHADLTGLPPLLIHVGSAEVLLDDAVRLAAAAGMADVSVRLEIWPGLIHVWHAFAFMLPEGAAAIIAAGDFLRAQLDGAQA